MLIKLKLMNKSMLEMMKRIKVLHSRFFSLSFVMITIAIGRRRRRGGGGSMGSDLVRMN
jgi:hypothetical protein